ncbi:ANTAR domain-containing protein [Streptomyces sp. NPDC087903]|uniref:ANTAR domain-containing protein n=1 Tax=Streptomyces sp. NPDC087903 TaxID=3365819 RepID=UPI0037FCC49E
MALSAHYGSQAAPPATGEVAAELERLRTENRQLRQAVVSHSLVDQAIGVLVTLGQISPQDGFTVLREISQHINIKLSEIAEQLLKHAQGAALADPLQAELQAALSRHRTPG